MNSDDNSGESTSKINNRNEPKKDSTEITSTQNADIDGSTEKDERNQPSDSSTNGQEPGNSEISNVRVLITDCVKSSSTTNTLCPEKFCTLRIRLQDYKKMIGSNSNNKRPHSNEGSSTEDVSQPKCQKSDATSSEPKVIDTQLKNVMSARVVLVDQNPKNSSKDDHEENTGIVIEEGQEEKGNATAEQAMEEEEPDNKPDDDDGITLAIRFPSGTTIHHTFQKTDTLLVLCNFIINHNEAPPKFDIIRYPNERVPVNQEEMTLQEYGFKGKELVRIVRSLSTEPTNFISRAFNKVWPW